MVKTKLRRARSDAPRALVPIPIAVAQFTQVHLKRLALTTREDYSRMLDRFARTFHQFTVDQVAATHIRQSIDMLYTGKATAARHYKSCISRFFRWCVEEAGLRADNPCREVWVARAPRRKTPWTDELFWKAREHLDSMHQCYHDLCFLLYQRTTDVRLLRWSQARAGVIHFEPTKTIRSSGAAVDIPVTPAIKAVLDRAAGIAKIRPAPGGDAYVIQTPDGGAFTRSGIYSAYRRADEAIVGKDDKGKQNPTLGLNPKALRPYALTSARKQGFGIEQLQVGAAHTSLRTTEGYMQAHEVPLSAVKLAMPERPA